ncbi:MAG TPA: hypothetical protein VFR91_02135 [Dyella sp.]|nr:hypothetical protein [Dyella sp.]
MDRLQRIWPGLQQPQTRLFLGLAATWLLLHLPVLLGIRALPWDAADEFFPTVYFNAHTLRMGMLPWWNPFIYSGYPQIADPQGMLFSPLLTGWMLLLREPGMTWFDWAVLLHLLMGGAAIVALLRSWGANRFGALLGAVVFMGGGVAAARLEHVPDVLAYGWSPVVLLALRHFLAAPDWRRGALFGLAAAALATHLVQVAYLLASMIAGYFIVASAARWRGYRARERWHWVLGTLVAFLVALAGGLPQLVFSGAFVALSNRASLPVSAAAPASLDPRVLLGFLDPNAWHALRGAYDGPASRVEGFLYIGAIPTLMLAGLGKAWRIAGQRRQLAFFAAVAALACLYMFGTHTPFYGWLYRWMPGLEQFRRPSDAAYLVNFSLAIGVGLGASQFDLAARRPVRAVLVLAALWLALASLHMRGAGAHWQAATILAALVALLALWRLKGQTSPSRAAFWLVLVLIADYRCFNLNGRFNQGHDNAARTRGSDVTAYLLRTRTHDPDQLPARIEPAGAGILWDNYVAISGLRSTQGYNPLRYGLYDRWYGAHENDTLPRVDRPYNPGVGSRLDDLLGVRYVVTGHDDTALEARLAEAGLARTFTGRRAEVWTNPGAYPGILNPVQPLPPGTMLAPDAFAATDFSHTLWLTPRDAQDARSGTLAAADCRSPVQVRDVRAGTSRIDFATAADAPGWLVLSELDFPGWTASIDGRPLPIHRANGLFRAICVPAGRHAIRFAFHPWRMVAEAWRQWRRPGGSVATGSGQPGLATGQHTRQAGAQQPEG